MSGTRGGSKGVLWERLQVSKVLQVQFVNPSDPSTDITLSLNEASEVLGKVVFSERLMHDIQNLIRRESSFQEAQYLKQVKLPSGSVIEGNFSFIIAKSAKHNLDFGILFDRRADGYYVMGLWPHDLVQMCKKDREVFEFTCYRLTHTPDFFASVTLYTPIGEQAPAAAQAPAQYAPSAPQAPPMQQAPPTQQAAPSAPATVPAAPAAPRSAAVDIGSVLQTKRCPFCNAELPAPRLQVLERGRNTFCNSCYNIIKGSPSEAAAAKPKAAAPQPSAAPSAADVKTLNLPRFLDPFLNSLQDSQFMLEATLLYIIYSLDKLTMSTQKLYNQSMGKLQDNKNTILSAKTQIMSTTDTTPTAYQFKLPAYSAPLMPQLEAKFQDLMVYGALMIIEWLGILNPALAPLKASYEQVFNQVNQNIK